MWIVYAKYNGLERVEYIGSDETIARKTFEAYVGGNTNCKLIWQKDTMHCKCCDEKLVATYKNGVYKEYK